MTYKIIAYFCANEAYSEPETRTIETASRVRCDDAMHELKIDRDCLFVVLCKDGVAITYVIGRKAKELG